MLFRPLASFAATFALATFVSGACAQSLAPLEPPADAGVVRGWLIRIHEAASKKNFQGTFVVSAAGRVSSSSIAHYLDNGEQLERIESLDGQMRQVYRRNNVVSTLWPKNAIAVVEQRDLLTSFPALLQAGGDHIVDFYDVSRAGTERVAGFEADVLQVRPKDQLRFGYRLWSEKASGLLLRAEVLDANDQVLESSAFSEVAIGVRPQPQSVLGPMKKLGAFKVIRPSMTPAHFDAEGWSLRQVVPGFRQVSCVKRSVSAPSDSASGTPQVLQAIFSDGLTYVSVFVEPFDSVRHARAMQTSIGATQTFMHRQGDWWITVIGDVPAATLSQFANGLERRK
ncbi:MucB/RseB C-terminal domain-containing protein [soil metagenome]